MTGEVVESVTPTRVTLKSGDGADGAHARLGRRPAGQRARPVARRSSSSGATASRVDDGAAHPVASGGVRGRRRRGDHRREDEQVLPQLGSVALQSGEHAGKTIAQRIAGKETKPFKYKDKGTMATIGRGAAVVQMLGGRTMKGKSAQLAWGTVHLALLPTNEDRAKAVVDWAGAAFTHQRSGRITVDLEKERGLGGSANDREPCSRSLAGAGTSHCWRRSPARSASRSSTASRQSAGSSASTRATCPSRGRTSAPTASSAPTRPYSTAWPAAKMNAMAATLRGDLALEGDSELLVPFQRLLPGPPRRRRKLRATAAGRRS